MNSSKFERRSISNYNAAVQEVEITDANDCYGNKFNSIFIQLEYFHVCLPGLPPCLGHDLFEGVISYDLALFLKYFIKTKKMVYI